MSQIITLDRAELGDGFRAFGLRDKADPDLIDPFLSGDRVWISQPTFPPHPHAGFSAISYLFESSETGLDNRDSTGNRNRIEPGGLHWTAAGRGVVHEEEPAVAGKTVRMLQIFVNLPIEKQHDAPFALSLAPEDVPHVRRPGVEVRVPLGRFGDSASPFDPPTDVTLLDIHMDAGATLDLPVPAGQNAFLMAIAGAPQIDGDAFAGDGVRVPAYPAQGSDRTIELRTGNQPAQIVLFAGTPLRQPVHWVRGMAMASQDAVRAAFADYKAGKLGEI